MSLLRVPCILLAGIGCHVAFTPPNPPPLKNERAASFSWDIGRIMPISFYTNFKKTVCWTLVVVESAVILASKLPSSPMLDYILSILFVNGDPNKLAFTPSFITGIILMVAGGLVRWQCYNAMGKLFTFEMSIQKDHKLVTSGPYAFIRHPSYTSTFCVYLGLLLWQAPSGSWVRESGILRTVGGVGLTGTFLAVISHVFIGMVRRTSVEDEVMKREFGDEWTEWAQRVPYKLVPAVY